MGRVAVTHKSIVAATCNLFIRWLFTSSSLNMPPPPTSATSEAGSASKRARAVGPVGETRLRLSVFTEAYV